MADPLKSIDDYLKSDDSPENSMLLSDLDGFLHGVACTPESIPESEWLSVAIGTEDVPEHVVGLVKGRLDEISDRLESQTGPAEPVYWKAPEGHSIAMDWCEGFMIAVKLRAEMWDAFGRSAEGSKLMLPILVHMFDENGNSLFEIPQDDIDETLDVAAEAIPTVVPAIYKGIRVLTRQ